MKINRLQMHVMQSVDLLFINNKALFFYLILLVDPFVFSLNIVSYKICGSTVYQYIAGCLSENCVFS